MPLFCVPLQLPSTGLQTDVSTVSNGIGSCWSNSMPGTAPSIPQVLCSLQKEMGPQIFKLFSLGMFKFTFNLSYTIIYLTATSACGEVDMTKTWSLAMWIIFYQLVLCASIKKSSFISAQGCYLCVCIYTALIIFITECKVFLLGIQVNCVECRITIIMLVAS